MPSVHELPPVEPLLVMHALPDVVSGERRLTEGAARSNGMSERARLLRVAGMWGAGIFLGFGVWELVQGGRYVLARVPVAGALAILGLSGRLFRTPIGPRVLLGLGAFIAAIGIGVIGAQLPRSEAFVIGCQLMIPMAVAAIADSVGNAALAGALHLLAIGMYPVLGGTSAVALEAAAFVAPAAAFAVGLTRVRVHYQQVEHVLRETLISERASFEELATTDGLTGLLNRRCFTDQGQRALELARRYARPLALIVIDVDHFKRVNDTHGHAVGDKALQLISGRCSLGLRRTDIIARIGGEELAVLLPETALEGAMRVAERLRRNVEMCRLDLAHSSVRFTISVGVAVLRHETSLGELLERSDVSLYDAKSAGRNRVSTR